MRVAGVDVWKSKWVAVVLEHGQYQEARVEKDFASLLGALSGVAVIGVDIPIGLPNGETVRLADEETRRFIGPRHRSSVFPVYPRTVYQAGDYAAARIQSMKVVSKSISRQAYAIGPRLLEVDTATAGRTDVFEVHPEASFCAMAGAPLGSAKASWNGMHERLAVLHREGVALPPSISGAGNAGSADLIDAAAAAWTAARIAGGQAQSLPEPPQAVDGRKVAIWY